MLRSEGKFPFGFQGVKVIPLSPDHSTPLPLDGGARSTIRVFGGVGPFDFSGASAPAAVPLSMKIDNGAVDSSTIDISGAAGGTSAVTATEVAAAIEASHTGAGYAGITASVDSRGYLQIDVDTPGTQLYLQVYGEAALLAEIGQGYGAQFIKADTLVSLGITPTMKDSETISITDGRGRDTEVITDSYRKGNAITLVDSAFDKSLMALIEGGSIDTTNGTYTPPNSGSEKKYFAMEAYRPVYSAGTNLEEAIVGYNLYRFFICTGSIGDDAGDRNFLAQTYNVTGTEYTDPVSSALYSDSFYQEFSLAEWATLDWWNI